MLTFVSFSTSVNNIKYIGLLTRFIYQNRLESIYTNTPSFSSFSLLFTRKLSKKIDVNKSKEKSGVLNEGKVKLILQMNFRSPEDALPFYKLPIKTLLRIFRSTKNDKDKGYCNNRLYYLADHLKCPSNVLSVHLSKRSFIYTLPFELLEKSLSTLLEMNVSGDRILRDLWVLRYHHNTIKERLQKVRENGVENLCPWMVRCDKNVLDRTAKLVREKKDILGETETTHTYLAKRLNTSIDTVEEMCSKEPSLKTVRVTKVKLFLDFLNKEGFEEDKIIQSPRILAASQKTVEDRLRKLRDLGLNDINLNCLCKSRKDFKRFCERTMASENNSHKNINSPAYKAHESAP